MKKWWLSCLVMWFFIFAQGQTNTDKGPLRVSQKNPRYFTNESGKAVYLTGLHTWDNLVDMVSSGSQKNFDFARYLQLMKSYDHNFIRLWAWELTNWNTAGNEESKPVRFSVSPHPWLRTGPETALDNKPKFDLTRFAPEYFSRLEERIRLADNSGIYVSIMLFEGWGIQFSPGAFENHPFHPGNNINGINGDADGNGSGTEIHTLGNKAITSLQEAYVKHVIDLVNKYDNVLYEISNENHPASTEWQYHMIRFIKNYEKTLPRQHPVGMTFQYKGGSNKSLFDSPADWISPNPEGGYMKDPPPAPGTKVIITDTDHLWGIGGNREWVWKSFLSGLNPIFMDPYECTVLKRKCEPEWLDLMRINLGYTIRLANRMDLISMSPLPALASSSYCLANRGKEYLVYLPDTTEVNIDLSDAKGSFRTEWFNPDNGEFTKSKNVKGGSEIKLNSPSGKPGTLVYLKKIR